MGLLFCAQAFAVNSAAIEAEAAPKLLSEFGFFADGGKQEPAQGVVPYDISTTLFTDHAAKYRFVYVPPGQAATYSADEAFEFPVGSALIKTFAYPADLSKPDENVTLIETRVMLRRADGWFAVAYVWNEDQTDAELKIAGARRTVDTILDGAPLQIGYRVPNRNQCKACHMLNGAIVPLGPKARNLNKPFDYGGGAENQLAHWVAAGFLSGAPDPVSAPSVPDWRDENAPLELRARAWLDVNCSHCHRPGGPASNSGLYLGYNETDRVALGIGKRPVAAGWASGGLSFDIEPGKPEKSIMIHRIESDRPGTMMPELGRTVVDAKAVVLLKQWIATMR
ncbi:MAG: SO2930 family diheme c-type cytochrome [Mesorhizobium sp.]